MKNTTTASTDKTASLLKVAMENLNHVYYGGNGQRDFTYASYILEGCKGINQEILDDATKLYLDHAYGFLLHLSENVENVSPHAMYGSLTDFIYHAAFHYFRNYETPIDDSGYHTLALGIMKWSAVQVEAKGSNYLAIRFYERLGMLDKIQELKTQPERVWEHPNGEWIKDSERDMRKPIQEWKNFLEKFKDFPRMERSIHLETMQRLMKGVQAELDKLQSK